MNRFHDLFRVFLIMAVSVLAGCEVPGMEGRVQEKEAVTEPTGIQIQMAHEPSEFLAPSGTSVARFREEKGSFFLDRPYRFPDSKKLIFQVNGVDDAKQVIGEEKWESVHSQVGGGRWIEIPVQALALGMDGAVFRSRLDVLIGREWKSYPIQFAISIPLPSLPIRVGGSITAERGGLLLGPDVVLGRAWANDLEFKNTSPFPIKLFVRVYSGGEYRMVTRINQLRRAHADDPLPTEGGWIVTPQSSVVRAEANGVALTTAEGTRVFDGLPGDWIEVLVAPQEEMRLKYRLKGVGADVLKSTSTSDQILPQGRARYEFSSLKLQGGLPREVVLASADVSADEVSRALSDPQSDPERIRFLTQGPSGTKPVLELHGKTDFLMGMPMSVQDWESPYPLLPEGSVGIEFQRLERRR